MSDIVQQMMDVSPEDHRECRWALEQGADEIMRLRNALTHIGVWYPISVSNPSETIRAIQAYALAALKENSDE